MVYTHRGVNSKTFRVTKSVWKTKTWRLEIRKAVSSEDTTERNGEDHYRTWIKRECILWKYNFETIDKDEEDNFDKWDTRQNLISKDNNLLLFRIRISFYYR